jgi:uncharacterized protein YacL
LNELQFVADSSDSMKRSRGRRGLDILNRMQKSSTINIEIVEQDFPKIKGVDGKLVVLAKKMNAKLFTNDYNLNKVAELQGVRILNVNELANAMKPVVLPGEQMTVKIIREGKEQGQGGGYQRIADNCRPDDFFGIKRSGGKEDLPKYESLIWFYRLRTERSTFGQ